MQGGDISDRLAPRWLFHWESVVASVPSARVVEWKLAMRLRRYDRAARCYEVHPHVAKVLWDLYWRRDYRFDVVTFLGSSFGDAVEKRLDAERLPFSNVIATDPDTLAKRLVFQPDVQYVIHGDRDHLMSYGGRGLFVDDPGRLNL